MRDDLSYEYINSRLRYEPETGKLFWRERPRIAGETKRQGSYRSRWNNRFAGQEIGCEHRGCRTNYRRISINGKSYMAHRVAWLIHYKEWPKNSIDHADGVGTNNKIENLRDVTHQENGKNQPLRSTNTSGVTGVCFHQKLQKWVARITVDGKTKHVGTFATRKEAIRARKESERQHDFHHNHGRVA